MIVYVKDWIGDFMKKKVFIMALVLTQILSGTLSNVYAQTDSEEVILNDETGIPDVELYNLILEDVDKNEDAVLQVTEAEQVKSLNIYVYKKVKNITGLSVLKNLEKLSITNYVNITYGELDEIGKLINLRELTIWNAELTNISALSNLINLEELSLDYNSISDIQPLANLVNLEILQIVSNNIQDISAISSMSKLQELEIYDNEIKDISPIKNLMNLQFLNCSRNNIKDITPLYSLENLRTLTAVDNKIGAFDGETHMNSLVKLYLERNRIEDISAIPSCKALRTVDLSNNQITDISPLSGAGVYSTFDLSNNQIQNIPEGFVFPKTDDIFYYIPGNGICIPPYLEPGVNLTCNLITKGEAKRKLSDELLSARWEDSSKTWFDLQEFKDDIHGDLTGDNKVSLEDTVISLKAALGIDELNEYDTELADMNEDGRLTLADSSASLKRALGIYSISSK